jgi:hypothetical protein
MGGIDIRSGGDACL